MTAGIIAQPAGCVMPSVFAMQVFGPVVHEGAASAPRATPNKLSAMRCSVLGMFHQHLHGRKHVKCNLMYMYGSYNCMQRFHQRL